MFRGDEPGPVLLMLVPYMLAVGTWSPTLHMHSHGVECDVMVVQINWGGVMSLLYLL